MAEVKYNYIISKKWTGRKDAFITLWRPNSAGYCFSQECAGKYEAQKVESHPEHYHHPLNAVADESTVNPLFVKVMYDNREIHVVPNTAQNRKLLGIKLKELDRFYRSGPEISQLKNLLV